MEEYTANAFANRDEGIPILTITPSDDATSASEIDVSGDESKRQRVKDKLREKAQVYASDREDPRPGRQSIQDRLFTKYVGFALLSIHKV